jgi:D-threo-aldose 1-dehydrogenase
MKFEPHRITLGCANLGGLFLDGAQPDVARAVSIISAAHKLGITKFDTAPLYGWGASEYFLGRGLEGARVPRDQVYISSKSLRSLFPCLEKRDATQPDFWTLGEPNNRFTHRWGVDYASVLHTTLRTLEMIRSGYLDGLSFHDIADAIEEDPQITWENVDEAVRACKELVATGFVRQVGYGGKESSALLVLLDRHPGLLQYASTTTYNLLDQSFVTDGSLGKCKAAGLEYRVAGPFCSRLLAEDPRKATKRPGKDGIERWYYSNNPNMPVTFNYRYINEVDYVRACTLWTFAEQYGEASPRAMALQFVLAHPDVASVIIGASNEEHLVELHTAIERRINPDLWIALKDEGILAQDVPTPSS